MSVIEYLGYRATVAFDAEVGLYHGEVIGIRDVITFQAKSASELRDEFAASVEEYLAVCAERSRSPDRRHSGLAEARRAIEQPLPTEQIDAAVQMLREVAREPTLQIGIARRAVARAARAVDGGMLAAFRRNLASNDPDWAYWRPRGLSRAEERAWTFVRGCASAVAFAESSLDYADDASSSYPAPDGLNDDARRALGALTQLDAIMAEEARETLIDLIRELEKASSWASLRGAIALRGGGSVRVAGVSQSQEILRALGAWGQSRRVTALLVPEPDNPHDKNAIAVHVASAGARTALAEHVGYLPRDAAAEYAKDFVRLRSAASGGYCDATIVGGFPLFEGALHRNRVRPRRGRAAKTRARTIPSGTANLGLRLDLAEPGAILTPLDR